MAIKPRRMKKQEVRNSKVRCPQDFPLITKISLGCDLQRCGKGVGQLGPPEETKRKTQDFQLPGHSHIGNHKIPITVYSRPAFSKCTTGDLEGKLPIKA